jgi:hypothetical protein
VVTGRALGKSRTVEPSCLDFALYFSAAVLGVAVLRDEYGKIGRRGKKIPEVLQ